MLATMIQRRGKVEDSSDKRLNGITESKRDFDISEKEALIAIYNATAGPDWSKSGRWLTNPEPSTWTGVVIESGHVTKLMLPKNNLQGELPDVFAALPQLKVLYLSGNNLTGTIPVSIGGLSKLECLDLSYNQFGGDIPRSLGGLVCLQRMLLDHNQLQGSIPSTLGCLSNLRWIDFTDNLFKDPLPSFLDFILVRRPMDKAP